MEKEIWPIEKLKNWDKNPRSVSKSDFERLKKQIETLGEYKPLLITEDGTVLGGNMRLRAYRELGWQKVWVSIVQADTDKEKLEYALSDNDRAGEYDEQQLAELVTSQPELDLELFHVDLGKTVDLNNVLNKFGPDLIEDESPEVEEMAVSKLGEIYQLGRHRVMCGDAKEYSNFEKLLQGELADLVVIDPPYNTGMKAKPDSTRLSHMFNDSLTTEQFDDLLEESFSNLIISTKGQAAFYVFIDWRNLGLIKQKIEKNLEVSNVIVWDKIVHGLGSDYKYTHEFVVVAKKGKPVIDNRIDEDYRDIWHVQRRVGKNPEHATAKPIVLLAKPILHASKKNNIVLDCFSGSGSGLIACEQEGRRYYGMEIDPRYVDVIRKRYAKFIGKEEQWQTITPSINQ